MSHSMDSGFNWIYLWFICESEIRKQDLEAITLANFKKNISAAVLKKADKLNVRDVDEERPNFFVAYVDQDDQSYDVSIELSAKGEIVSSGCDCEAGGFCIHRVALANYLSAKKTKKPRAVRKKKLSQAEELLESLNHEALKKWVAQLFGKNKDLELLFVNEFSEGQTVFTAAEVKLLIQNSIKSVIKNKKRVEAGELKKIVDMLDVTLKPVIASIKHSLLSKDSLQIMMIIVDELERFDFNLYINSVRIKSYLERFTSEIANAVSSIVDNSDWQKAIDLNTAYLFSGDKAVNSRAFDYFISVYKNTDKTDRKKYFAQKTKEFYLDTIQQGGNPHVRIAQFVLEVTGENEMFEEVYTYFKPLLFENEFNLKLIDSLIEIDQLTKAEQFALQQIESNYYPEFNYDYWKRLETIYRLKADDTMLASVLMSLVPFDFDFAKFEFIKDKIPAEDFKKFRSNLLAKAKRSFGGSKGPVEFYFAVLDSESGYKKMLELIGSNTDYDLVYKYKEKLFAEDKINFLKQVFSIESSGWYYDTDRYNAEYRDKLTDWILEKYDAIMIETVAKSMSPYSREGLYEQLKEKM